MLICASSSAHAWPRDLAQSIARDALRLVPRSLAELLLTHEAAIFSQADALTSKSLPLVYADLPQGRLRPPTRLALAQDLSARARAFEGPEFGSALVSLGASYRLAVDLADPGIGSGLGRDPRAQAIRREFYAFVTAQRSRLPLVVAEPESLKLTLARLPDFLSGVVVRASAEGGRLRREGQEGGRVLSSTEIDFRSPVFAVASSAYSRSVGAVAATWIAIWREAGGDMTRARTPRTINPRPFDPNQDIIP